MKLKISKIQIICLLAGLFCYLLMKAVSAINESEQRVFLARNSYGQGELIYPLWVEGLGEDMVGIEVVLRERSYEDIEIDLVFDQAMQQAEIEILGDNSTFSEICHDLKLISEIPLLGVTFNWSSSCPEIIDSFGKLYSDQIPEEGIKVHLTALLASGSYSEERKIELIVYPQIPSSQQMMADRLLEIIDYIDQDHQSQDGLWLPMEYEGTPLRYQSVKKPYHEVFLFLGILSSGLFYLKDENDKKRVKELRKRQMQLDYSELVSRFMIFIGAGMTVRKAWEFIVKDYEKRQQADPKLFRYAYEELSYTWSEIDSGIPEGKAYERFGKNCGLNSYLKLSGLLEQSRRIGNKNLQKQLNEEMQYALETRKQIARKLGEEAGTKLLLPLFLLLAIVMAMIMIPALWSMI